MALFDSPDAAFIFYPKARFLLSNIYREDLPANFVKPDEITILANGRGFQLNRIATCSRWE